MRKYLLLFLPLLVSATAPKSLVNQTQLITVTSVVGNCETTSNYKYKVELREDGTFQTREMDDTLTESGTYVIVPNGQVDQLVIDYVAYPALRASSATKWHELQTFTSPTEGTISGTETSGDTCSYEATFTLQPTVSK